MEEPTGSSPLKPPVPTLSGLALHVWTIPLIVPDDSFSPLRHLLAAAERDRASRFHFEKDARRFIVARASVRSILAAYTTSGARDLRFHYSPQGKPSLAEPESALRFNISHSSDLALLAVTHGREVGIDIEYMRKDVETEKLSERFFSEREREALRLLPRDQKVAGFFRCWTCKEAFLKALGSGLSRDLSSFDVDLTVGQPAALLATRPDATEALRWSLREVCTTEGYAAAVAVEGTRVELSDFQYAHI
jgi:4'-phosphopantetheinyl transferase